MSDDEMSYVDMTSYCPTPHCGCYVGRTQAKWAYCDKCGKYFDRDLVKLEVTIVDGAVVKRIATYKNGSVTIE